MLAAGLDAEAWGSARLARAPTRFGTLALTFSRPAADRFSARWQGVRAPVRLRVPPGYALAGLEGDPAQAAGPLWVVAPVSSRAVTLLVRAAGARGAQ